MTPDTYIKKSSGALEPFDKSKLIDSLEKAGASMFVAEDVANQIEQKLKEGMPTAQIYTQAFKLLRKKEVRPAIRYSLRRSIADLGPTGFPFEDFVGEIFKEKGYKIINDLMVNGHCIEHEIDIVAYNDDHLIMTEIKFHNQLMLKSDVKVALYIKARFDDLVGVEFNIDGMKRKMTQGLLLTNTKFTENAIKFGACAGVNMIGWNYPAKGNLHDLIEETGLHPLTCLTTLSGREKKLLLDKEIVTCKNLKTKVDVLKEMQLTEGRIVRVLKEIGEITKV
ncbi:MAG: ATP cone domain-containing protein [bacterium]